MKKIICLMLVAGTLLLSACGKGAPLAGSEGTAAPTVTPENVETPGTAPIAAPETVLPTEEAMEFTFSSGAGAWRTWMLLEKDGTFSGEYSDSNAGESGEGYLATVYKCAFTGAFTDIRKIDDYAYAMTLGDNSLAEEPGKEWIEENVRYVASEPYGLEEGKLFILYTPDTPLAMVSEEFLSWWPGRWDSTMQNGEVLGCYGIYNQTTEQGFFSDF